MRGTISPSSRRSCRRCLFPRGDGPESRYQTYQPKSIQTTQLKSGLDLVIKNRESVPRRWGLLGGPNYEYKAGARPVTRDRMLL